MIFLKSLETEIAYTSDPPVGRRGDCLDLDLLGLNVNSPWYPEPVRNHPNWPEDRAGGWFFGVPKGSRTPVVAVKGRCPRPLDDGDDLTTRSPNATGFF